MAKLTIQIPDELASRLEPLQERLPQLLEQLLLITETKTSTDKNDTIYTEVLDFLIKQPTLAEIRAFKVSSAIQERLSMLLDKNRESVLTSEEIAELETYEQLEHLMILLKAQATKAIK